MLIKGTVEGNGGDVGLRCFFSPRERVKIPHPQPVLAALRQATADRHRSIEALLALDSPLDTDRYGRVLQGFGAFLAGWEPLVLAAVAPADAAWVSARSRQPMLLADLQALGLSLPHRLAPLRLPSLPDAASAWGSMYVLEGSALGGQVIAKSLERQLRIGRSSGAAYFHGWGDATGAMWKQFRDRIEHEVGGDDAATRRACQAAVATFDCLMDVFAVVLDEHVAA